MADYSYGIYPGQYAFHEIPQGVRVVPQFDDLVHPARKIGYIRDGDLFTDDDGDIATLEDMRRWWSWVKFSPARRFAGERYMAENDPPSNGGE